MKNINVRLQEMTNKLTDNKLFDIKGLGNEINFHIFDYDPEDEYIVRDYLYNYLSKREDLKIKIVDVYDVIMDLIKDSGILEQVIDFEKDDGANYANNLIYDFIGFGTNNNKLIQNIQKNLKDDETIILCGLGKSYGIVRGHVILNNLKSTIDKNPVIMMYPGVYTSQSFTLFNKIETGNYYRAFQLVGRE